MLKTTSLASVIALNELLHSVQNVYSRTYQEIPLLIVAAIWYLLVTSILTAGQFYVERYFGRGATRNQAETPIQKLRRNLARIRPHAEPGVRP